MILYASVQSATPASFDGETLELAFPPKSKLVVTKVEDRVTDLQAVLQELFGISPAIKCVVREPAAGGVAVIEEDDDGGAPDEATVLERLKTELNAEVATEGDL